MTQSSLFQYSDFTSERGGVVVECGTPNREVLGSIPTGITMLTVLVKPKENWLCTDMTETLLTETLSLNTI